MKLKVELILDFDEKNWFDSPDEKEWFEKEVMAANQLHLHSNEPGETIGETLSVKFEYLPH